MINLKNLFCKKEKRKPQYEMVNEDGMFKLYEGNKLIMWGENPMDILLYIKEHSEN